MSVIAFIILGFTLVQFLVSLINLIFREKPKAGKLSVSPLVSVLIPARNEEENIKNLLEDIQKQNYSNLEILVFNDQSEDKTADVVRKFADSDSRIRLVESDPLPEGWLGKNYACHLLSGTAAGEYYLFLDADVRISGDIIKKILSLVFVKKLALVSIFPRQVMVSAGEKATVPVMNYILLSLLPLILVRKSSFPSLAAANGQFMFFNAAVYKAVKPHEKLSKNRVEDIETARMMKSLNYKIACLTGNNEIKCRMYRNFEEAVKGFSKNIACFFGNSYLLAVLFWVITTFGFVPLVLYMQREILVLYFIAVILTRVFVSVTSEQKMSDNILYLIPQQLAMGLFIFRSIVYRIQGNYEWKGRRVN